MAGLCWMAVTLGLLLSVGNSSADFEKPDQNQLARIVEKILADYTPRYNGKKGERSPMFSLAVSIPYNGKEYDISQVIASDPPEELQKTILRCEVYRGTRVVAATLLKWPDVLEQCPDERVQWPPVLEKCQQTSMTWAEVKNRCPNAVKKGTADHAEYRTLQAFNTLTNNLDKNDFLLFYVLSSPCDQRCTSESNTLNILDSINKIKNWNNYAVVFSKVFKPRGGAAIPTENLKGSLERLGSPIGLKNIYRCYGQNSVQCTSCSSGNQVTPNCYTDEPQPGPSSNLPSNSRILPQRGRSNSPSQSSQGERDQRNNNINTSRGVSTNVDGNPGGVVGQGGSGGGKRRRRRGRGKKGKKTNEGEGVSSSQSGLEVRNTDVEGNTGGGLGGAGRGKARRVGGRRVGQVRRRGGTNKQKSNKVQRKNKRQSRGNAEWSQEAQGRPRKQSRNRQNGQQPQRGGKQRGGEMRRINQPQKRRGKKKRRG
ncbi:uncharacterized protein LOC129095850 [Anoplopoma fimbria]|uniref:uncharacterized protein LOC129095850 n=1 Tax=Anoplopoma fimbria TaxID=229290 RepID=UPI0023EBDFB4|nr:uncharacterized protein LOC129095850 [Anoplopoma fimbria]